MSFAVEKSALVDVLTHADCVLFVGSGISTWSNLPTWNQLLLGLIAACERRNGSTVLARDALARGNLLDAADKLADVITPLEIATTLRKELGFADAKPHEIHRLLTNLGPERFVTTNFDNLIEQQLGLEGRLGSFRTVTNRQIAELADIQKASANRFVFKPHGDLAEAESLVLASTHYDRILLGASNLVRPVLETLFVSRPILFIGYGLRDPDMLLLLRTLKERYNGNAGEFYAIIADASKELVEYYWRQYRLRVFGYPTSEQGNDHRELLALLRSLSNDVARNLKIQRGPRLSQGMNDSNDLIRYAARLITPASAVSFPVRVLLKGWRDQYRVPEQVRKFHGSRLSHLLESCTDPFVLQGPAGSGKSFSISDRLSRAGQKILNWSLENSTDGEPPVVPILLDARLYRGDFGPLIAATAPASLDLQRVSQAHKVILIVDSLDEMPAKHLESGHWRSNLEAVASKLKNVSIQFGTRRADLISDPSIPVFLVQPLAEGIVIKNLEELGRTKEEITPDLFEALKTPFTLAQGRRLLGLNRDITSTPALFSKLLDQALERAVGKEWTDQVFDHLSALAADVLSGGYDTIPIETAASKLAKSKRPSKRTQDNRWLIERLVDAGILVSEIDSHVRFVHRSVAEFLAAFFLLANWRRGGARLSDVLSVRRWDNAVAWASTLLDEPEGQTFLREVYLIDPEVAARLARAAEVGKVHVWSTLFELVAQYPPPDEQQYDFIESLEDSTPPNEALPRLRSLTVGGDAIGGWAAALLAYQMPDAELRHWMERVCRGELDFNFINHFGPTLGARIEDQILEEFLEILAASDRTVRPNKDPSGADEGRLARYNLEAVIGGLSKSSRDRLLAWSRGRSATLRGSICNGIRDVEDDIAVQRYLASQFDRHVPEAVFSLYLGMVYGKGPWMWWTLPYTSRRLEILIGTLRSDDKDVRWALELTRCLVTRNQDWRTAITDHSRIEKNASVARVLRLLLSPTRASAVFKKILLKAPKPGAALTSIERALCTMADHYVIDVDETEILESLKSNTHSTLGLLADAFFKYSFDKLPIKITRLHDWITLLHSHFSIEEWPNDFSLGAACSYLARAMPISDHVQIIRWANDRKSSIRDFVLGLIVPRMMGITTDDLTPSSGKRLLDLYVNGHLEPHPSPGEIATEQFIAELVLPYAQSIKDDPRERQAIQQVLTDAGRRHDRRYAPPWQVASV
ncbi:SIR2 family protein [Bradyrhizobium sp. Leo121]|uniref:SIR2 family NAD-dependent protein deacylase n=1 Tax=Bradyrhizobium sp. Leo121 TaxID=1571195 RepID=UPI00102A37AF|nr:SIR2 family protein [Bradyrhizobium sp. Leo121]RZN12995.1 hypothetical protein CWO90_45475 [Bradyrhizobium sp. Leo121]